MASEVSSQACGSGWTCGVCVEAAKQLLLWFRPRFEAGGLTSSDSTILAVSVYALPAGIVFLFGLASHLEDRCMSHARAAIGAVLQLQPDTALVLQQSPEDRGSAKGDVESSEEGGLMGVEGAVPMALDQVRERWNLGNSKSWALK
jgi:hypothetical protein